MSSYYLTLIFSKKNIQSLFFEKKLQNIKEIQKWRLIFDWEKYSTFVI